MLMTQCDNCREEIKDRKNMVAVRIENFQHFEFCGECGKPIIEFLKTKNLIDAKPA